jgi:hypothetical protein
MRNSQSHQDHATPPLVTRPASARALRAGVSLRSPPLHSHGTGRSTRARTPPGQCATSLARSTPRRGSNFQRTTRNRTKNMQRHRSSQASDRTRAPRGCFPKVAAAAQSRDRSFYTRPHATRPVRYQPRAAHAAPRVELSTHNSQSRQEHATPQLVTGQRPHARSARVFPQGRRRCTVTGHVIQRVPTLRIAGVYPVSCRLRLASQAAPHGILMAPHVNAHT